MRWLILLVLSWLILPALSSKANAYDQKQDEIVRGVVKAAQARHYPDDETKWAILSNTFEVPNMIICAYLPKLSECQ